MSLILYLSKTVLVSGLLYSYYWLFLRNKQFHQYNRFYLLGIPVIACCLPLFNIPVPGSNTTKGIKLLKVITVSDWEKAVVITARQKGLQNALTLQHAIWAVYMMVALVLLYAFLRSIFYVLRMSRKYVYEKIDDIRFFHTPEPGTPFSFMKNIFWNDTIAADSKEGEQVFRHELYHVRQKHTTDILFAELVGICCWFNPFFHLLKREIKVIHEFLADRYAASETNKHDYAELLIWQSIHNKQLKLANPFFHNQVKRRITMITKFKNARYDYISRVMALPLLFALFCAFAVKLTGKKTIPAFHTSRTITVVVDAGHGGIDPGTAGNVGVLEKNLTLSIAKKIQDLSGDYHVNVIMTRDKDILPGNAATIQEGLTNRTNIAESNKADLFISIHIDAAAFNPSAKNGFSIYLSGSSAYYQKSVRLGSALAEEIKKTYGISPDLKQRQRRIKVLDDSPMPSVMIECGYITNQDDVKFITDDGNQGKIAKDILEGIVKYANSTGTFPNAPVALGRDTITPQEFSSLTINHKDVAGASYVKEWNQYEIGSFKLKDTVPSADYPKIFTKVEVEAEYPGGPTAWWDYLKKNFVYPEKAINKEIQGTVLVRFIVNTDSTLSDIRILKSPDKILSDETFRIIKNSGKWIPASQKGQQVRAYKLQPLVFKLERQW